MDTALANSYNASGNGFSYDDLIAINGNARNGYYLAYYRNYNGVGAYLTAARLPNLTPRGGIDWNNWKMATTKLPSGTAMFLWNESTVQLHLWERIAFTDNGDMTGAITFIQYEISSSWLKGTALSSLQAADLNADGVPDLWAVTLAGSSAPTFSTTCRPVRQRRCGRSGRKGCPSERAREGQRLLRWPSHDSEAIQGSTRGCSGT